jgi:acetyltransferase
MSLYNLDKIFRPASIAVVGASQTLESIGRAVMTNLIEGGYEGKLFPVNPKYDQVQGRQCHARLTDLPETPDLAVIAIPIAGVPDLIDTCVAMGVPGAVILSAGGREAGEAGRALEERIKEKAMAGGLRIVGPNCLGVVCPPNRLNASFATHMPPVGNLAFISQSGAVCSAMIDLSLKENLGYRYFISIGSMLDVDFGDLVDYVGNDLRETDGLLIILNPQAMTDPAEAAGAGDGAGLG